MAKIAVLGAGIVGLWQAFVLKQRGHSVFIQDPSGIPTANGASRLAGAMLAPYCEGEPGHEIAHRLGVPALELWKRSYPGAAFAGSLVVAHPRDRGDLERFAQVTQGYQRLDSDAVAALEPALGRRFADALFYPQEGHVEPLAALDFLAREAFLSGVRHGDKEGCDWLVDCRGLAAADGLRSLRGVRGERILIECGGVELKRPIRLLHPRISFYIVPWSGGRFMIGATVIESEDAGPPTLRSVAELLSLAYSLMPAFGEARVIDIAAGIRPSFPDNAPKVVVRGRRIFVNGLYRHGFLLSPILAEITADYIERGEVAEGVVFADHGEW